MATPIIKALPGSGLQRGEGERRWTRHEGEEGKGGRRCASSLPRQRAKERYPPWL